jgi:hypothetical protein
MPWRKGRNNRHYSVAGLQLLAAESAFGPPHAHHKIGTQAGHSVVLGLRATRNLEIPVSLRQGWVIIGLTHRVTALGEL